MDKFDFPHPIKTNRTPADARFSIIGKIGRRWQTFALFCDYPSACEGLRFFRNRYPHFFFDIHQLIEF